MFISIIPSTLKNNNDKVSGIIYFTHASHFFPNIYWYDFIVIILCWWINDIRDLRNESKNSAELLFMEGDYLVRVTSNTENRNNWTVDFVVNDKIQESFEINSGKFLKNLKEVANQIILKCYEESWLSTDLVKLEEIYKEI